MLFRSDQKVARKFNNMVDNFLKDPNYQTNYKELNCYLKKWDRNHEKLQPVIASSPILQEIKPASANLEQVAQLGCKALEKLHKKHNTNWLKYQFVKGRYTIDKKKAEVAIQEASQPVAQTEIMVLSGIEKLINEATK